MTIIHDMYAALNDYRKLGFFAWLFASKSERALRKTLLEKVEKVRNYEMELLGRLAYANMFHQPGISDLEDEMEVVEVALDDVYHYVRAWVGV